MMVPRPPVGTPETLYGIRIVQWDGTDRSARQVADVLDIDGILVVAGNGTFAVTDANELADRPADVFRRMGLQPGDGVVIRRDGAKRFVRRQVIELIRIRLAGRLS